MSDNQKKQNVYQHKCPNCGAWLKFDANSGQLKCDHCQTLVDFDKAVQVNERDFTDMVNFSTWADSDVAYYSCSSCGANTVLPRTALATKCPFCDSPVVVDETTTGLVRPDTVVPFMLDAKQASKQLRNWQKGRVFAPNKFRKTAYAESIKGVYVPAWTFDAETFSQYSGTVGKHKTRTVRRNGKTYTESYTQWYNVSGNIQNYFDDLYINAGTNVADKYFRQLTVVDKSKFAVYNDEYLAGYIADNYTVDPVDAHAQALQIMERVIRRAIVEKHNADVEGTLNVDITETSRSFKYVMLPIYVTATKYRGKLYNQYVSGVYMDAKNTKAKVCGKAPISPWKVLFTVLAGLAVIGGLVYLYLRTDPDVVANLARNLLTFKRF